MAIEVGDRIEFTLKNQDGEEVSAASLHGKPVVLFVYPRADTPGCTIEACEFRDVYSQLRKAGATLLGISRDTPGKQKRFAEKYSLPYPLLADPEMSVLQQLGVVGQGSMYGKPVTKIERSTFVLDKDGRLAAEFRAVKPEGHAEQMVAAVKKLGRA